MAGTSGWWLLLGVCVTLASHCYGASLGKTLCSKNSLSRRTKLHPIVSLCGGRNLACLVKPCSQIPESHLCFRCWTIASSSNLHLHSLLVSNKEVNQSLGFIQAMPRSKLILLKAGGLHQSVGRGRSRFHLRHANVDKTPLLRLRGGALPYRYQDTVRNMKFRNTNYLCMCACSRMKKKAGLQDSYYKTVMSIRQLTKKITAERFSCSWRTVRLCGSGMCLTHGPLSEYLLTFARCLYSGARAPWWWSWPTTSNPAT